MPHSRHERARRKRPDELTNKRRHWHHRQSRRMAIKVSQSRRVCNKPNMISSHRNCTWGFFSPLRAGSRVGGYSRAGETRCIHQERQAAPQFPLATPWLDCQVADAMLLRITGICLSSNIGSRLYFHVFICVLEPLVQLLICDQMRHRQPRLPADAINYYDFYAYVDRNFLNNFTYQLFVGWLAEISNGSPFVTIMLQGFRRPKAVG